MVEQSGVKLVVAGYSDSHVIGALVNVAPQSFSKEDTEEFMRGYASTVNAWKKLEKTSFILEEYKGCYYTYLSEELLRFKDDSKNTLVKSGWSTDH